MFEVKLRGGVKFVAELKKDDKGGEVILHYILDRNGQVVNNTVTCTCSCGSGANQTLDLKTCTKEESKNASCDCTGLVAKVIC